MRIAFAFALVATLLDARASASAAVAPGLDPFGPRPKPVSSAADPVACVRDDQCPTGTICDSGTCKTFERSFNVLLFRKEGPRTAFIPFYWSRRGSPGYRVVAPLYWHFWDSTGNSRVVAPFYFRFTDFIADRVVTVIPPYSHTKEPGAESWAVWPIYYRSTKFGWAAPLLGSFKVGDPDTGKSLGLFSFLYFWQRHAQESTAFDLGFPLFVSSRSKASAFTFALPLNFYWRSEDDKHLLALPLFYWAKNKTESTLIALPGYHSRSGTKHKGAALWLYWFGREGDSAYDVFFPLFWSFRSTASTTTIIPPVFHFRRDPITTSAVLPLYFAGSDSAQGSSWKLLLPLSFWHHGPADKTFFWLSPIGGYRRNDEAGSKTLALLAPPVFWRQDPHGETTIALLLYWKHRNLDTGATTRVIGPYVERQDAAGSTRGVLPFWWWFDDRAGNASAAALFPLAFWRRSPHESSTALGVFPLLGYHRTFTDGGSSLGLFPIAFFGQRGGRSHGIIPPLFFHFADERGSATVVPPFFYHLADAHTSSTGILPLLYFQGRDHQRSFRIQFPFFWRLVDGAAQTTTTVVPPVYWRSRPDGFSAGLFPLLFAGDAAQTGRSHFVLFPLLWRFHDAPADHSTTVVLNFLHRRHGSETTDALFPLFHWRRGTRPGGHDETSFTLFPFVHYRRDADSTVFASPLWAFSRGPERKAGFVLPYFWYQSKQLAARGVPLLWLDVTQLESGERTRMIGPYFRIDGPATSGFGVFPLFTRYTSADDDGTFVFPNYFRRRAIDRDGGRYDVDTLMPLFWWSRGRDYGTLVVGPWFKTHDRQSSATGLLPLYVSTENHKRSFLITPLFFRHRDHEASVDRTVAAWLYYRWIWPEGHRTVVLPFYWSGHRGERSHTVGFPVFWHFADTKADTEVTFLGPFYSSRTGRAFTRGLLPLAWISRDPDKQISANAILPLFYESHGLAQTTVVTLPFGFRAAPDRSWWYVGPLYQRDTWQSSFSMLFPVWFSHVNKSSETRTTVIPPLLAFRRAAPDRTLTGFLGLFWRRRTLESGTTLGLPLFYDVHAYHESRTTLLLPLFLRHRRESDGSTFTLAPLFYRQTSPTDSTTVAFPLFWDFRSAERRTTLALPLFVRIQRPTFTERYVFPNVYWRTGHGPEEGTSRLFVLPFWESAVKRRGDFMWEVLLGVLGWERIGRNRIVKVLFLPFDLAPAPAATTAWYGKTPTRPRRSATPGLATNVW